MSSKKESFEIETKYVPKLTPDNKEQSIALQNLESNIPYNLLVGPAGTGKAQPLDAYIKTPYSWKRMRDIRIGDLVSTPSGISAPVTGIYPQGKKDIFKVSFSDGRSTECCDEHLWEVYSSTNVCESPRILSLKDIRHSSKTLDEEFYIKLPEHEHIDDNSNLRCDPYELGCSISSKSEKLLNEFIIPNEYLYESSKQQKLQLIDGLLGSKDIFNFHTSSKVLAEQFQYLIRSVGGTAKVSPSHNTDIYHVVANYGDDRIKFSDIEFIGRKDAQCIMIDSEDHLYITDDFVVTHNTLFATVYAIKKLLDGTYKKIVITRPAVPVEEDHGFLPGPQPLDAKVLTPTGWTTMGELKKGDMVIAWDGSACSVNDIFPKGTKDVYKIKTTSGQETEACADHLWMTQTHEDKKRNRSGTIKTTAEILDTINTEKHIGKGVTKTVPNHYLPTHEAVEFNESELPISPYTLGSVLGGGSLATPFSLHIDSRDSQEVVQKISNEIESFGCVLTKQSDTTYVIQYQSRIGKNSKQVKVTDGNGNVTLYDSVRFAGISENQPPSTINSRCINHSIVDGKSFEFIRGDNKWHESFESTLDSLGLLNHKNLDKFIPEQYMFNSSIHDRLELLRGLMDSLGTIKSNGEASFHTTSIRLAEGVEELVRGLGGRCNMRTRNRIGRTHVREGREIATKHCSYEFTISMPQDLNPFYVTRKASMHKTSHIQQSKIESIECVGTKEVQCISIDHSDHLYITDDHIVTHNTILEKMNPWMLPIIDVFMEFFDADTIATMFKEGVIEIAPLAYMRGRNLGAIIIDGSSDKRGFIVIADECQNSTPEQMKMLLTRLGKNSKMIITGDLNQHDRNMTHNGLRDIVDRMGNDDSRFISLDIFSKDKVVRSAAVQEVLSLYPEDK